jgi:hypothetical protein
MDPRKFDAMVQRLSESLSRRNIVGGTIGSSLLAAAGLRAGETDDDALAKGHGKGDGKGRDHGKSRDGHHRDRDNGHGANAEKKHHNNNNNNKHKHKKKKKKCKKDGHPCSKNKKCCSKVCFNGFCGGVS